MKFFYLIISILFFLITPVNAQERLSGMYNTKNGHVVVIGKIDTTTIIAESDKLLMILNCENSLISATLDIKTLHTGINRFDNLLKESAGTVFYTGKIGTELIHEIPLPLPLYFSVDGALTLNSISRPMKIKVDMNRIAEVDLNHLSDTDDVGMLSGSLAISLKDFHLAGAMPGFSDLLIVQFTQIVLRKVCE